MKRERLKVRRSAKARAAALVAKIERAIEQGEFVPSETYLFFDNVRGPCGCAMAAASFVSGGTEADDDYAHCKKVGLWNPAMSTTRFRTRMTSSMSLAAN